MRLGPLRSLSVKREICKRSLADALSSFQYFVSLAADLACSKMTKHFRLLDKYAALGVTAETREDGTVVIDVPTSNVLVLWHPKSEQTMLLPREMEDAKRLPSSSTQRSAVAGAASGVSRSGSAAYEYGHDDAGRAVHRDGANDEGKFRTTLCFLSFLVRVRALCALSPTKTETRATPRVENGSGIGSRRGGGNGSSSSSSSNRSSSSRSRWQKMRDPKSGRDFWFDQVTGTSQWEDPLDGLGRDRGGQVGGQAAADSRGSAWVSSETQRDDLGAQGKATHEDLFSSSFISSLPFPSPYLPSHTLPYPTLPYPTLPSHPISSHPISSHSIPFHPHARGTGPEPLQRTAGRSLASRSPTKRPGLTLATTTRHSFPWLDRLLASA